jgi:ATP-dependent DNA helicase Q4
MSPIFSLGHSRTQVKQTSQHLLSDIRALLRQSRDVLTSGRLVAKVLHGLASSATNADVWRRNPAWGKHTAVDFDAVQRAADAELTAHQHCR